MCCIPRGEHFLVINDVAASRQGTSPFVLYWWFTMGIMALFLVAALVVEKLAEAVESGGSPEPHPGFFVCFFVFLSPSAGDQHTGPGVLDIEARRCRVLYRTPECHVGESNLQAGGPSGGCRLPCQRDARNPRPQARCLPVVYLAAAASW